jgi:TrmH family RNA methyltransferase
MLSKNKIKFINSIKKKKYRDEHQCFFVEGEKLVDELLKSNLQIIDLFATKEWILKYASNLNLEKINPTEISNEELQKISSLSTPNKVFAIVSQPKHSFSINEIQSNLSILLDNINDPGNLGTIIRIADWFGIKNIFCTTESVDVYNPKVVQSTMGAIYRTKVHYVDFYELFNITKDLKEFNIYGTFLEGENIYKEELPQKGFIIMGSESHGISEKWKQYVTKKLFIPNYPIDLKSSESLNISVATAIICSEFRRNT